MVLSFYLKELLAYSGDAEMITTLSGCTYANECPYLSSFRAAKFFMTGITPKHVTCHNITLGLTFNLHTLQIRGVSLHEMLAG